MNVPCANCGKEWPQCLSNHGLACVYLGADQLDEEEWKLLEAEIIKRGLPFDTKDPWVWDHRHGIEPCWKHPENK